MVYILGLENGLIPHERAVRDGRPENFEEERRLLFVAVTRAQEELHLTQTMERTFRGMRRSTISSRFVSEMPLEFDDDLSAAASVTAEQLDEHLQRARQRYEQAHRKPELPAIMSAADLLKQQQSESVNDSEVLFEVGSFVRHPRYGRGTVINATGRSARATVTVRFEADDRKQTFVASRCPLQPLGTH